MKKYLKLALIIIVAVAAIGALIRFSKMDSFSFAWALNFILMLFVAMFSDVLNSPLTAEYYNPKSWERDGKIYELLGINVFRKLLVWIGWEKLIRKAYPIDKSTAALSKLYYQTKKSEFDHLVILVIVLGFNIYVAVNYGVVKSLSLLILNILMHLYPILLQRYNRPRIEKALRLSRRVELQSTY